MRLSKTSALAALAMAYLAHHPTRTVQARQVAEHLGIATESALKILQTLTRQRLIRSQLGRTGGYRLHRPAEEVTLLEIVEAIDGPIGAELPLDHAADELAPGLDLLHSVCVQVAQRVRQELRQATVADVAHGSAPAAALSADTSANASANGAAA